MDDDVSPAARVLDERSLLFADEEENARFIEEGLVLNDHPVSIEELEVGEKFAEILTHFHLDENVYGFTNRRRLYDPLF